MPPKSLVLDSDGLVKLEKAGMLQTLAQEFDCLIPEAVYDEVIRQGKKEAYEEAFKIEKIVESSIKRQIIRPHSKAEQILQGVTSLGKGEKETLNLYFDKEADGITSDDRTFLNLLQKNKVRFFTSANSVVELVKRGTVANAMGMEALNKMKALIRDKVYQKAKQDLEDLR